MSRFLLVVILSCLLSPPSIAQVKEIRRVLIFNEYGPASPAIAAIDEQIRKALDNSPYQIELYSEFLETALFPDQTTQQEFRQWYLHKYRARKPDVIVAVGPAPIRFMAEVHQKYFSGVPVVFCASSEDLAGNLKLDSSFTGIWERIDPSKTIDVALKLQPKTLHLFVVGGTAPFDIRVEAVVRGSVRPYKGRLDIIYLTNLDMPTLLVRLKALPKQSIVLFTALNKDAAGHPFIAATQSAPMVAAAANAPVFSLADVTVGHGEVGGYVMSYAAEGAVAGAIVSRILSGERPEQIPIVRGADTYTFDWPALKRWGIDETKLPPGSIVLHRQPDFWELYRYYVLGAIFLVVAEGLLILALFWQRARRRTVEESLRISETRLQEAQGIAHCGAWEWIIATDEIHWSDEMYRILGLRPQSVAPDRRLLQADELPDRTAKLEEALQTRQLYCLEHTIVRPDGETRIVVELGQPKYDSRGKPVSVIGTLLDITERRQAEQRLRESEQRFRTMADGAPVMMWISGVDKRCTDFNRGWLEFTGRPIEQQIGDGWADSVHPDDLQRCLATYVEAFDARRPFTMEYRLRRYDGQYRWITDTGTPRFMHDGTFAGYIGCCIDINDQKMAELARRDLAARLMNAQETERVRIARELHDSIGQSIALLTLQMPVSGEPAVAEHLGTRHLSLEDMKHKLKALGTQVSRLSHQIHSSELEFLGLQRAIEALCGEFSEQYSIHVNCSCVDVPRKLDGALALAFFRVTQEALHNITKHSQATTVHVSLTGDGAYLVLVVRDDGIGFRTDLSNDQPGLGLVSMRERIHLLGGDFAIRSSPGAGTAINAKAPLPATISRAVATNCDLSRSDVLDDEYKARAEPT
jgi:PAS domain S-box-containing protein